MHATVSPSVSDHAGPRRRPKFRPGDLVVARSGYRTLFEVICVEDDSTLRVRGLNWASGYSALIAAEEVHPATSILTR